MAWMVAVDRYKMRLLGDLLTERECVRWPGYKQACIELTPEQEKSIAEALKADEEAEASWPRNRKHRKQAAREIIKANRAAKAKAAKNAKGGKGGPVLLAPGEKIVTSGQYVQVNPTGRTMKQGVESTLSAGEPAPPTARETWRWKLVDATKHKPAKGAKSDG